MLCWRRFHLLWRFQAAFAGLLTFPCLGYVWAALRVVWVGAPRVGAFGWFPFTCGWAVISALCAARERAPPGVWLPGVVALVAYAVSGCPVTVPVGYGCGVSLRVGRFRVRARLVLGWTCCCVLPACPFARRGVPARLFVCRLCPALSHVAGLLRFVLFVGYCMLCVS